MAKAQLDVVEMDIEEVMGLIAPQKKHGPSQASLHSPSESGETRQQYSTGRVPPIQIGESFDPPAGQAEAVIQSPSETGTKDLQRNAMEDDELYDPLAGDDSPPPSLRVKKESFEQGTTAKQAVAASEGPSISKGASDSAMMTGVPLRGVEESAKRESEASQQAEGHSKGTEYTRHPSKAAPLAGLLEQYDDEESEEEEEGGGGIEERGRATQREDEERGAEDREHLEAPRSVPEMGEPLGNDMHGANLKSKEGERGPAEERVGTKPDVRGGKGRDESGGMEKEERQESGRRRDGGEASARHSEHGARYGAKDYGGGQDRRRDNWQGSERSRHPDDRRNERDAPPDELRGHKQSRGDFEKGGGNSRGGFLGRERDRGDRRRADASFRGGHKDTREWGRESEIRSGPRTEQRREGRDREPPSRYGDSRHRMRPRSPAFDDRRERPPTGPGHKLSPKADSRPDPKPVAKADQKSGPAAKAGSTGADVDLSAAVAAAAAAAAKSAKLAASRAPPPPADPAEAAAKAAEMGEPLFT